MAAIRSRISTLLVILVVAVLAATVGYQLAQSSGSVKYPGSDSIRLLDRNQNDPKGPPPACYKHPEKLTKNPNCPQYTGDKPHG